MVTTSAYIIYTIVSGCIREASYLLLTNELHIHIHILTGLLQCRSEAGLQSRADFGVNLENPKKVSRAQ